MFFRKYIDKKIDEALQAIRKQIELNDKIRSAYEREHCEQQISFLKAGKEHSDKIEHGLEVIQRLAETMVQLHVKEVFINEKAIKINTER